MLPHAAPTAPSIPFHTHHDGRIVVHPISDPARSIDVTESVIRCISSAIGDAVGGNAVLNRLEAERAVHELTRPAHHVLVEASR